MQKYEFNLKYASQNMHLSWIVQKYTLILEYAKICILFLNMRNKKIPSSDYLK